jgi:hypothetical protein
MKYFRAFQRDQRGVSPVIVKFWVRNTENNMQFFTERLFLRNTANLWY